MNKKLLFIATVAMLFFSVDMMYAAELSKTAKSCLKNADCPSKYTCSHDPSSGDYSSFEYAVGKGIDDGGICIAKWTPETKPGGCLKNGCSAGEICVPGTYVIATSLCVLAGESVPIPAPVAPKPKAEEKKPTETEKPACGANYMKKKEAKEEKKPACSALYEYSKNINSCVFSGARGIALDSDSLDGLESNIESLKANESSLVSGKFKDGKEYQIGIIKKADGTFEFTADGVRYSDDLKNILRPGFFTKIGTTLGNMTRGVSMFFGVGKYSGKGTTGVEGKDAQRDGQAKLDSATIALGDLNKIAKDKDKQLEAGAEAIDRWMSGSQNLIEGNKLDVVLDELKAATGCDLGILKKILSGEIVDAIIDKGAIMRQLYTFPAQSVITLAKELRAANFAAAANVYIKERAEKSPEKVMELMQNGQLPELDLVSNIKGANQQYAPLVLFTAYEEAYQRYLLAKGLKK